VGAGTLVFFAICFICFEEQLDAVPTEVKVSGHVRRRAACR
jgi:hypothetical protein